jgi:hypothetical protein
VIKLYSLNYLIIKLTLKKINEGVFVRIICLDLEIVDDPSVKNALIFNHCLNRINKSDSNFDFIEQENKRLADERNEALQVNKNKNL